MLKRIITAVVAIAIFLPILYFSNTMIFAVTLSLLALIGCSEMLKCIGVLKRLTLSLPMLAYTTAFPLLPFWLETQTVEHIFVVATIVLLLYLYALLTFSKGKWTPGEVATPTMSVLYITLAFAALSLLRYDTTAGQYVYLICMIGAWVTDTFAYFCGYLFGKHKLIPDVSPKKTVEGSIGGTLFCAAALPLYGWIVSLITKGQIMPNYLWLVISGFLIALVSQLGDLLMSAIKRTYGIKDYGKLFPGHGGVLDRFDSVLAVALVLFAICALGGELFTVVI